MTAVPSVGSAVTGLELDAVDGAFLTQVKAEAGNARQALDLARSAQQEALAGDANQTAMLAARTARLDDLNVTQRRLAGDVLSSRRQLKDLAISAYVSGGPGTAVEALLRSETISQFARRSAYLSDVAVDGTKAVAAYVAARDQTAHSTLVTVDELGRTQSDKQLADRRLAVVDAQVAHDTAVLADRLALLSVTIDAVSAPGTDIPRMVLDAYQRAAAAVSAQGCRLAWWGLAGIGRVESDHGRDEHARLAPNGDLSPPIIGVRLDGTGGTAAVTAANGDFAHAEGPMQFIPSAWALWGRDGNGDHRVDVDNIYDAAMGTATYLCSVSTELTTDAGLQAAYFSYNHSAYYVNEVLAYAHAYAAADAAGAVPPMAPLPLYRLAPVTGATSARSV